MATRPGLAALTGPGALALPRRFLAFWLGHVAAPAASIEVVQALDYKGREDRSGTSWLALRESPWPP